MGQRRIPCYCSCKAQVRPLLIMASPSEYVPLLLTLSLLVPVQMKVIPFLILVKAVQDISQADNAFHRRSLALVLDVCMAIYGDGRSFKDDLFTPDNSLRYLLGPQQRTVDIVPNTSAWSGTCLQAFCAATSAQV